MDNKKSIYGKLRSISCILGTVGMLTSLPTYAASVNVNANTEYQTIRGFGGMNAPGWVDDLTPAQVDTAFGNGDGQIGLSIMRMRIDPDSSNWSIQVPAAVRAKSHGAILLATPWTPPAYMKTNNSLINGGRLKSQYYGAYTDHLLSFSNYMSNNGASLYAMSIINEPDWHPEYESSEWSATDFVNFLSSQGSRFGSLKVVAPESLNFNHALSDPFLNNSTTRPHVDIIGGHLYGKPPQDYPLARSLGKELWMTEHYTESDNSANKWPLALDVGTELHASMVSNFNAYIWWYIRRSYGLITEDGNVSKRGYLLAQYSKFVRPGYTRIGATQKPFNDVYVTAYKGPDNKIVVVAVNTGTSHRDLDLAIQNASVGAFTKYTTSGSLNVGYGGQTTLSNGTGKVWVDPQSVATFVSDGASQPPQTGENSITIRARGTDGTETISLQVGGSNVQSWGLSTSYRDYSVNTDASGEIRVVYANDGDGRDVQVDNIVVNGQTRQAEDQEDNTAAYGNGACGGIGYSEWMHCNGYISFGDMNGNPTPQPQPDSEIIVRASGIDGSEHINLLIDGVAVANWTLTTSAQSYIYNGSATGEIQVEYDNDADGRDVILDYVYVNNETRQAEDMAYNTATYDGSCGGGSYSEMMHCNGVIGFGSTEECLSGDCSGNSEPQPQPEPEPEPEPQPDPCAGLSGFSLWWCRAVNG